MASHRFLVRGLASPDLPLRVLNLFAQQDLAYDRAEVARDADRYVIRVAASGLAEPRAAILLEKMRMLVLVESAELSS